MKAKRHPEYATVLFRLGNVHHRAEAYEQAEPFYLEVLNLLGSGGGEIHPVYAKALFNLADLYSSTDDYGQAIPRYREALAVVKSAAGESHPLYARFLNSLGNVYQRTGKYDLAEPLYLDARRILGAKPGETTPKYATVLNNLAALYAETGRYDDARLLHRETLEIRRSMLGTDHPDYATSLNNLAGVHYDTEDYELAEPLFLEALEILAATRLGKAHPHYGLALNNLAGVRLRMGEFKEALELLGEASDLIKANYGDSHQGYATALNNLADVYHTRGAKDDYEEAERLYLKALGIIRRSVGESHPNYAVSLNNLADLYHSMGSYDDAFEFYTEALRIFTATVGDLHADYSATLSKLAALHVSMGNDAQAESLFVRALAISREILERTAAGQSERQQMLMARGFRDQLDNYLSLALRHPDMALAAFEQILRWKGATFIRQRGYRQIAQDPGIAPVFDELRRVSQQLSRLMRGADEAHPGEATERRKSLAAEQDRLEAELSRQSAVFRRARHEVSLAHVAKALPNDAALVVFLEFRKSVPKPEGKFTYRRSILASVLRVDGKVQLVDLGDRQPVHEVLEAWRTHINSRQDNPLLDAHYGQVLREALWQPLLPALDTASTVLISPDGILGGLPWAALPGASPGTHLIDSFGIAFVPVPQLLPSLTAVVTRPGGHQSLLLVGDVDYGVHPEAPSTLDAENMQAMGLARGSQGIWDHLKYTLPEINHVRSSFPGDRNRVRSLVEGDATEERLRELAPEFTYLHIATHGYFNTSAPRSRPIVPGSSPRHSSGLVLAGANHPQPPWRSDDGYLTAMEIVFLPLEGVDLAVLSACQTGLGVIVSGEGLLGVQEAFQVAGVRSAVASLWQVDDPATHLLMAQFYDNMWHRNMSRLEALRQAQLHVKTTDGYDRPYYWAAFQLSGDWR